MAAMFNTQQGGTAQAAPQQPTPTGAAKPTGLFSAGNAFGQQAQTAYNNTANYLQNNPMNYNAAPALPGVNDFSADRQRIEQALMGRARTELDTRYGNETAAFEQRMANEGVDIGSDRYRREKEAFERDRNEAYNDANFRAMLAGGDEQSRLFGLGLQARQQAVTEQDSIRASQLADLAAMVNPALKIEELMNEKAIADQTNATNRYGIDQTANTANLDRSSRDANALRTDNTSRLDIQQRTRGSDLDRRSREFLERNRQRFEGGEKAKDRKLTKEEKEKDRQNELRRARISASAGDNVSLTPEDIETIRNMNKTAG
ncbi:MAG: hypothetical protein EB060_09510 [Proteobacteria bacterium]|nr:hypothetical protein [Pseudomonadota bacterium]